MRRRARRSRPAARPSSASGGSSTVPSPTAWRKRAIACSALPACRRASGAAHAPRTPSNDCMKSSSDGSRRRRSCRPPTPRPCCSGRCLPPVRSTCARSMAGRRLPQSPSISRLTSPLEAIPSSYRRSRHAEFQPHSRRHLAVRTQCSRMIWEIATWVSALLSSTAVLFGFLTDESIQLHVTSALVLRVIPAAAVLLLAAVLVSLLRFLGMVYDLLRTALAHGLVSCISLIRAFLVRIVNSHEPH